MRFVRTQRAFASRTSDMHLVAGRIATSGSTFAGLLVISASSGFATRGYVDILLQAAAAVAVLGGLGAPAAMTHFAARRMVSRRILSSWLLLSCTMCAALAGIATAMRGDTGLAHFAWAWVFAAIFGMALATNTFAVMLGIAVAAGETRRMMIVQAQSAVGYLFVIALAVYFDASAPILVVALALTYFIGTMYLMIAIHVLRLLRSTIGVSLMQFFGYGSRSAFGTLSVSILMRGDILLLAKLVAPNAVGRYTTVLSIMEASLLIPSALSNKMLADLSAENQLPRRRRMLVDFRRLLFRSGSIVLVCLLAATALCQLFVWHDSQVFLLGCIFAPGYLILMSAAVSSADLSARGSPGRASIGFLAGVTVMLLFDLLTVPRFGILAAAAGSTLGYIVAALTLEGMRARRVPH